MAEVILVNDRVRARDNDYRRGGDPLPESGIVIAVLGTEGQYSEAAMFIVKEKLAAISDVEPWARQDDE